MFQNLELEVLVQNNVKLLLGVMEVVVKFQYALQNKCS
jgi:hypothetical protein